MTVTKIDTMPLLNTKMVAHRLWVRIPNTNVYVLAAQEIKPR